MLHQGLWREKKKERPSEAETEMEKQRHREIETWGEDKMNSMARELEERRREMLGNMVEKLVTVNLLGTHIFLLVASQSPELLLGIQGQICEKLSLRDSPAYGAVSSIRAVKKHLSHPLNQNPQSLHSVSSAI